MEEYFNTIDFDKSLQIIAYVIGFLSLLYMLYDSNKNKIKKSIKLNRGQTFSIFKRNPTLKTEELRLLWNNKEVGDLFLLDIYLKNTGNTSLKKDDFLKPVVISFDEDIEILKTKLFSSSEYTQLKWKNTRNEIALDLNLLEKKKLIKVEIIYTNDSISPANIDIAILDGNIETVSLNTTGQDNTDREMDAKLYSTANYYVRVFVYFILPLFLLAGAYKLLENNGYKISNLTKTLVISPLIILSFYYIFKHYGESMSFRDVKNWVEFEQKK